MRVNLLTASSGPYRHENQTIPLSLTIRPSCGLPGDYLCPTDSTALLRLLRRGTDLPSTVLKRFEGDLYSGSEAKLLGVELDDKVLTAMGYFID